MFSITMVMVCTVLLQGKTNQIRLLNIYRCQLFKLYFVRCPTTIGDNQGISTHLFCKLCFKSDKRSEVFIKSLVAYQTEGQD